MADTKEPNKPAPKRTRTTRQPTAETASDRFEVDPKRVHFVTLRMDEENNKILVDVTGVTNLEAVKMLEGALETLDCTLPEVAVVRDGKTVFSSDGIDDDDDD